ncbi:MAG: hypothetical protein ACXWPM_08625, partial [Bdellovibrionota bacterium]
MSIRTLAVLAIGFVAATGYAATPPIRAEHVRGKVIAKGHPIPSEAVLTAGTTIQTGSEATVEIHAPGFVAELAPFTRVLIQSSRSLSLLSGQIRFRVPPRQRSALGLAGARLHLAGSGEASILAAATRTEKQYAERLEGRPQSSESGESMQLAKGFAELITVSGEFGLRGPGGRQLKLTAGDW